MKTVLCKCECGQIEFNVTGDPELRMLCHCTICQNFNQADFADILVFKTKQVSMPPEGAVEFATFKKPPNVQRGKCAQCGQAAIEVFDFPLMPKLTMVPAGMFSSTSVLPQSKAHMFYDKRVNDVDDDLPKHHGFMSSQWAFFKYLRTTD